MKVATLNKSLIKLYLHKLEGPEGCNLQRKRKDDPGSLVWKCTGTARYPLSKKILRKMGVRETDITRILKVADEHIGLCDCGILFNAKRALLAKNWASRK